MSAFMTALFQPFRSLRLSLQAASTVVCSNNLARPESVLVSTVRTKVRCYFPRPNEVKRVRRHGWEHRMSTPNGRKIIMRRILKGRHVLTH